MSVLQEIEPGDEMVVIQDFNASPEGEGFSWETSGQFRLGECVKLVRYFQDDHYKNLPGLGWTVVFETSAGNRYAATQTYFVAKESWGKMKRFFARRLMREPKRRGAAH